LTNFFEEQFTGFAGVSFDAIVSGKADDVPESAFMYVGGLDSAREKAKKQQ